MPINILMPALSPTMTEGNLAKWHKKEGTEGVKVNAVIGVILEQGEDASALADSETGGAEAEIATGDDGEPLDDKWKNVVLGSWE